MTDTRPSKPRHHLRQIDRPLPGGTFVLNDHDPKPLYHQLVGSTGEFSWEYQEGLEVWQVLGGGGDAGRW